MSGMTPSIERERPPYIRFETRPVEDRTEETVKRLGNYGFRDVDFVLVTPAGSKDVFEREVKSWFEYNKLQIQAGRLPPEWQKAYEYAYEQFKLGKEIPVNGTPIKTWPALSPSQIKFCIAANVLTIEDLAALNDEGLGRLGMGAAMLKQRAIDWLREAKGPGQLVLEMTDLRLKNQAIEERNKSLEERLTVMAAQLQRLEAGQKPIDDAVVSPPQQEIRPEEVLEEDSPEELQRLVDQRKAAAPSGSGSTTL